MLLHVGLFLILLVFENLSVDGQERVAGALVWVVEGEYLRHLFEDLGFEGIHVKVRSSDASPVLADEMRDGFEKTMCVQEGVVRLSRDALGSNRGLVQRGS